MYQGDAEALHQSLARIRGVAHEIASALRESYGSPPNLVRVRRTVGLREAESVA